MELEKKRYKAMQLNRLVYHRKPPQEIMPHMSEAIDVCLVNYTILMIYGHGETPDMMKYRNKAKSKREPL